MGTRLDAALGILNGTVGDYLVRTGNALATPMHVVPLKEKKPAGTQSRWLPLVHRAIYVGTPHRGVPMERMGRALARVLNAVDDPYTRLAGQLAELRSAGIKDPADAAVRPEDRARRGLCDPHHP